MENIPFAPGKASGKPGLREVLPKHQTHGSWKLFYRLHESLAVKGFNPIPLNSPLLEPNEIIYNRAIGCQGEIFAKSNYFVFVKIGEDGVKVMHSDPDTSPEAISLKPKQIHRLHEASKDSQKWVEETISDIEACAGKKAESKYFFVGHGHWGYIDGKDLNAENMDDGISDAKSVIRQMMFYNVDLDGTGHHNNYLHMTRNGDDIATMNLWQKIGALEESAGISKVPSVELTMPSGPDSRNGAHHNLWFASDEVAVEYHMRILKNKWNKYCVYAPYANPPDLKAYHQQLRNEGILAVGIAHPAAGGAGIGLLNRVQIDMHLDIAMKYAGEYADGICGFNTDITSSRKLVLDNPSEMKTILDYMGKWHTGDKPRVNAINMAFAQEMRERYGLFMYANNDAHDYSEVRYSYSVNMLGKMSNVVDFGQGLAKKPGAIELVGLMRSKNAKDLIVPFIPFDPKTGDLVDSRNYLTLIDRIKDTYDFAKRVVNAAPKIWDALKDAVLALQK